MLKEEYCDMQEHLLYITSLIIKDIHSLSKIRGVEAIWDGLENEAKIKFYYDGKASEEEIEEFSVACTEIIAHCSNATLEEKFIRWDYPKSLPESSFWAYRQSK